MVADLFLSVLNSAGEGGIDYSSLGAVIPPSGLRRFAPCLNSFHELIAPSIGFESGVRNIGWLVNFFYCIFVFGGEGASHLLL